ncbi:hypothetical protein BJ912DRAFT_57058 [Pholiota molesta]|nr:hypothetical protein BJ912DRAFT_57058 [Pholiota molesta]
MSNLLAETIIATDMDRTARICTPTSFCLYAKIRFGLGARNVAPERLFLEHHHLQDERRVLGPLQSLYSLITLEDTPRLASFMDSIFAIGFGLGLRFVVDAVSQHDFKLTGTLVGLWEGIILLHFLRRCPSPPTHTSRTPCASSSTSSARRASPASCSCSSGRLGHGPRRRHARALGRRRPQPHLAPLPPRPLYPLPHDTHRRLLPPAAHRALFAIARTLYHYRGAQRPRLPAAIHHYDRADGATPTLFPPPPSLPPRHARGP